MKILKSIAVIGALFATSAFAATNPISFDTNGAAAGGVINVSVFDWTPDNALAQGAVPLQVGVDRPFTLYSQARLGAFIGPGGNVINGTGLNSAFEITFQTGFSEIGTLLPGGIASFGLDPAGTVNFFNVYYDTSVDANQVTGGGYGDGTLILTAIVTSNSTIFLVNPTAGLVPLDQHGANNAPGVGTVVGNGGGSLTANVTGQDSNYFLNDFDQLLVDLFFTTNSVVPFLQADPSDAVVGQVPVYCPGNAQFPNGINGFTFQGGACDFHIETDANTSFATAVPEPGSLALVGLALSMVGFGALRRKS